MPTTRLRITLRDVHPPVTRVLDVPASTTLPELHDLLQVAMGWTDSHLHQFVAGERIWGVPHQEWDDGQLDEAESSVKDLPAAFVYLYDFGDSWEHDVEVLGAGGEPGLVEGSGACPPEDCGGFPGYEELQRVLADPSDPEHEHLTSWSAHHSFTFDERGTARLLQQVVGSVLSTVRAMFAVVGDGLKLTQAGKLPPASVADLLERCPNWDPRCGSIREDNIPQVWALKDLMREVGLLRLSRGVLSPTKAATDDLEVVRRLRRRFPNGDFQTLLLTDALAVLAIAGPLTDDGLLERVLPMMGGGWTVKGQPLTRSSVGRTWGEVWRLATALDLMIDEDRDGLRAGPSALTLLPRAAQVAQLIASGRY